MADQSNRRAFLRDTSTLTAGFVLASEAATSGATADPLAPPEFASRWGEAHDRIWLGPEYWANPMQDWRIAGCRIECVNPAPDRHVHLLTRALRESAGELDMSVRVGRVGGGALGGGEGSFGFRVGIQGPLRDYRNNLIAGQGLNVGLTSGGTLFLGDFKAARSDGVDPGGQEVELRLTVKPDSDHVDARLVARDLGSGRVLGEVRRSDLVAERFVGGLALVANFAARPPAAAKAKAKTKAQAKAKDQAKGVVGPGTGVGAFWFADWRVAGSKVEAHDDRGFGPILFSHYSLSRGVMKLTAQMPPLGPKDSQTVRLAVKDGDSWKTVAEEPIHPEARTATFRIPSWDDTVDTPYRLAYTMTAATGSSREHEWTGTVRRDPVDEPVITVADVSCNTHAAFPNADYVAKLGRLDPDLIAFVGDQFYEGSGGYGVVRGPLETAIVDYLRKWYLHGWTWRELTRDRPSLSLPDDHDVYQGNVWGESGAAELGTQERGGYQMPAPWVNVVYRTQAAHHPDPADPTPIKQGISVYYGPMTYGRISFAIIADRQFKSGPEGKVPPTGSRGDHVVDPAFDPKTADLPGLELLGTRQERFLREWAADWRGAEMKGLISQTVFTAMATTHGAGRERLRADYDANGWPQTPRNRALREIRKAFAVHIAGDQHLPAVVHYGVDEHRDAGVAFAGPAVNVGYPRWWEPAKPGASRAVGDPENTGDFLDHFGNPMTVLAVANGSKTPRPGLIESLHDKASGLGLVRFDKRNRTVTFDCWPFLADVTKPGTQFPGWPVTVNVLDNDARRAAAHLPRLVIRGIDQPVVQVVEESSGEVVYTLRISGQGFRPHVFSPGTYTVRVSEPETGRLKELRGLAASRENDRTLEVVF
jgi:alkaline phosphatase D